LLIGYLIVALLAMICVGLAVYVFRIIRKESIQVDMISNAINRNMPQEELLRELKTILGM